MFHQRSGLLSKITNLILTEFDATGNSGSKSIVYQRSGITRNIEHGAWILIVLQARNPFSISEPVYVPSAKRSIVLKLRI
jgi:hypothetical protein